MAHPIEDTCNDNTNGRGSPPPPPQSFQPATATTVKPPTQQTRYILQRERAPPTDPRKSAQQKRKRSCQHRTKRAGTVNIGFLNMHGARKASKREELYATLDREALAIYSVAETHLQGFGEPPIHRNRHWTGCNREADCRGGGVNAHSGATASTTSVENSASLPARWYLPTTQPRIGAAERVVQTIKNKLKKARAADFETKIARILLNYRITPHQLTSRSPAELLMGRRLKTELDLLHTDLWRRVGLRQLQQKGRSDRGARPEGVPPPGAAIWAKNFKPGDQWVPAPVGRKTSASSAEVLLEDGTTWVRHRDHIRARSSRDPRRALGQQQRGQPRRGYSSPSHELSKESWRSAGAVKSDPTICKALNGRGRLIQSGATRTGVQLFGDPQTLPDSPIYSGTGGPPSWARVAHSRRLCQPMVLHVCAALMWDVWEIGSMAKICSREDALAAKLSALETETEKLRGEVAQLQEQIVSLTTTSSRIVEVNAAMKEPSSQRQSVGQETETRQLAVESLDSDAVAPQGIEPTPYPSTPDVPARREQSLSSGQQANVESQAMPERVSLESATKDLAISLDGISHITTDSRRQEVEVSQEGRAEGEARNDGEQSTQNGCLGSSVETAAAPTLLGKERGELPIQKGKLEAAQKDLHLQQLVSQPTEQGRMPIRSGGNWVCPARSARKEVLIVGDANEGKMAAVVLHAMDSPGVVGLLYGKKATTATALKYIASYKRKARPIHRRYVLHVSLVEILRRTPEEIIHTLNASSADSVDGFAVCSIPDVATKGAGVRAAILLANASIKKWCRRTHHRFIDLSTGWQDTMLEKDGLYSLEGASFVTAKISQATLPFLDKRWQNQRKPDAPRSETPLVQQAPNNRSVEPMSASATTLHPAPPRSLAQRTPLLQFSQPTLQPQEGVPWTPAMGTLPEPVQTLQAPPLPVSHMMPPPVSSGHHQMPASQVSSTVPSMHPRVPHSAAAMPT
ncbi:hypothetical protein HPB48_013587 [Haemaphysalis longicornis]|uniref:Uncharacterized protein n=1 Tax=Haemaphysalis longicornis TaxID=44386 RepID=A0A9J6GIN2_HAELO|nr:hypothetical protein HPB48_013587 [Haemaphysalis longicornis]